MSQDSHRKDFTITGFDLMLWRFTKKRVTSIFHNIAYMRLLMAYIWVFLLVRTTFVLQILFYRQSCYKKTISRNFLCTRLIEYLFIKLEPDILFQKFLSLPNNLLNSQYVLRLLTSLYFFLFKTVENQLNFWPRR